MNATYICQAGQNVTVNVFGFKKAPKILKLKGSWYFQECITCNKKTSTDYYFNEGHCFDIPRVESESYCKLKFVEVLV